MEFYSSSKIQKFLKTVLGADLVPFLQGSPGMGKSSIVKAVAQELNLKVIDVRLSQVEPVDLLGLPDLSGKKAMYKPFNVFPLEDDEVPEGYDGWLLFFDEFNSALRDVQAASYRIILDREVGVYKLHDKVRICCSGNLSSDRAIVNRLSSALQSRLVHLYLKQSFSDWIEWAYKNGIDTRICAYLNSKKDMLLKFDPDSADCTYPCPRTWEMLSKIIKGKDDLLEYAGVIDGTIGEGPGCEFRAFIALAEQVPTPEEIAKDPENCKLPRSLSAQFFMTSVISSNINEKNAAAYITYLKRIPSQELTMVIFKMIDSIPENFERVKKSKDFASFRVKYVKDFC